MKNSLEGFKRKLEKAENINKLQDRPVEISQSEKQKENNEANLTEPKRPVRHHQVCQHACNGSQGEERKQKYFCFHVQPGTMAENLKFYGRN